jgi:uncharacterized heparinase superfamily protein
MHKYLMFFNTVKYLKWQQVYYRLFRFLKKPSITDVYHHTVQAKSNGWLSIELYDEKIDRDLNANFLNKLVKLDLPNDWNNDTFSKLWIYNLHYFECLLSRNSKEKSKTYLKLLNNWVDYNPVGHGNGWEPYPTSLRVTNTLKAWLNGLELEDRLLESVYSQASYLSNDLEKHLLGNHYFVNLKALLFAGVIFNNKKWVGIALVRLEEQIYEQINADGAHFELSPMYHSLMLVDMLDIYNLVKAYPNTRNTKFLELLMLVIPKMQRFLHESSHPDGGVSFFNDSVNGIAPTKEKINEYSRKLGFDPSNYSIIDEYTYSDTSGYISANMKSAKLIFDAAPIGSDYIPGHAHADTLSLELSVNNQRMIVNSGISEYGLSNNRLLQRQTRSHSTVEIDNKDSSQVWSGFRVGSRAKILKKCSFLKENTFYTKASHDGYKSFLGGCIHKRKLTFTENSLNICDEIIGIFKSAKSRIYFHPDLELTINNEHLTIKGKNFISYCDLLGTGAMLFDSYWHPEFGISLANKGILIDMKKSKVDLYFTWHYLN